MITYVRNSSDTRVHRRESTMTSSNGEKNSVLLALCARNSPVTGEFPQKGQWRRALMFSLICAWLNGWVNNCDAGDLRRHRGHYDVTIMSSGSCNYSTRLVHLCTYFTGHTVPGWLTQLSREYHALTTLFSVCCASQFSVAIVRPLSFIVVNQYKRIPAITTGLFHWAISKVLVYFQWSFSDVNVKRNVINRLGAFDKNMLYKT